MPERLNSGTRRAFTLTELAIVMAIVGLVLGAIWVASGRVINNNRAQKAAGQVLSIVNNYRTLYAQHGVDVATGTDITCTGVNAGFFPADMVPAVACVTTTTSTYPSSPWGSAAGGYYVQVTADQTNSGISVTYAGLGQSACIDFASATTLAPDVIYEAIAGNNQSLPPIANNPAYTTAQISGFCNAAGNTVIVEYKAR